MTISSFTAPGTEVVALKTGFGITRSELYTVRGFVINRHARTHERDPHVLLEEVLHPQGLPLGKFGEIGFPRDVFDYPSLLPTEQIVEAFAD